MNSNQPSSKGQKPWYEDWEYISLTKTEIYGIGEGGKIVSKEKSDYLVLCLPNSRTKKLFILEAEEYDEVKNLFDIATSALMELSKIPPKKGKS